MFSVAVVLNTLLQADLHQCPAVFSCGQLQLRVGKWGEKGEKGKGHAAEHEEKERFLVA